MKYMVLLPILVCNTWYICHNFSPFVPAGRGETCMLVIRAEDGMLGDMEGIFRDVFRDHIRP